MLKTKGSAKARTKGDLKDPDQMKFIACAHMVYLAEIFRTKREAEIDTKSLISTTIEALRAVRI
jgi:hypothetical protein